MSDEALDLMWALVLESGKQWGEVAADFQTQDAIAIFSDERPNYHFITRPRGGSKSTDIAAIGLSWLALDAPPMANGHIVASSTDQAAIVIDAAAGLVARTPELEGSIVVESRRIVAPNGAWVEVLAQSDSGAWGLRDAHLLIADEFCQWPETRGAQRVWTALTSAAPKVPTCKLIVLSSAGEPSHWSRDVFEKCELDPMWRVSETPGPVPWLDPEALASLQWQLRPSEYERLVLNKWSADEDRAVSDEDWSYAAQDYLSLAPRKGVKYIILVDIGILNDATVMVIAHKEPITENDHRGPQRVVIDLLERRKGSKTRPVQLSAVEDWIVQTAPQWNGATVYADPSQFMGNIQNLNRRGVRTKEFPFTATTVGEVATALVQTFRNRQIYVPAKAPVGPILKDELLKVRLRESAPGVTRLDHDRGGHDDQAVTIGMACRLLLGNRGGVGTQFREFMQGQVDQRKAEEIALGLGGRERNQVQRAMNGRVRQIRADRVRARRACQHRWNPERTVCLFCGTKPAELVEVSV